MQRTWEGEGAACAKEARGRCTRMCKAEIGHGVKGVFFWLGGYLGSWKGASPRQCYTLPPSSSYPSAAGRPEVCDRGNRPPPGNTLFLPPPTLSLPLCSWMPISMRLFTTW